MKVEQNASLQPYNSFGITAYAHHLGHFKSLTELQELLSAVANKLLMILGGGSNILFTKNVEGWVLKNEIPGITKVKEDDEFVYVKVGAGENWHQLVLYCIEQGWAGIENLSLIPGNVGATPMQNIGAYGVEIKDVFHELEAWHIHDKIVLTLTLQDCEFGYRESVFKNRLKNQAVILTVTYRLKKKPKYNTSYGAIEQELQRMGVTEINMRAISQAVINIRSSKLPDPKRIGNAGSFFKNPPISLTQFNELQEKFPGIVGYRNEDDTVKLAAGWLIEQCGWKGFRRGDAGCHTQQALVLVNYGTAAGNDIYRLSEEIVQSVVNKFNVVLQREVNIW
jgi:UDP-N-acetylmuramate dehydrogenase